MMVMRDEGTGQPVCHKCHEPHRDPRSAYCPSCAQTERHAFGLAHSLRTNTAGDPDRPVRRVEVAR